jgi:hypothetical protein
MVALTKACNPSYLRGGNEEDHSKPAQGKSSWDPHLNQWLGMVVHTCHTSYDTIGNRGKHKQEDLGPRKPRHKVQHYLKNTSA